MTTPRSPLDPDLNPALSKFDPAASLTPRTALEARRKAAHLTWPSISRTNNTSSKISHTETTFTGADGTQLTVSVLRSTSPTHLATPASETACILHFHGGGFCMANRFHGLNVLFDLITELNVVVVSPEYRLAPEHAQPAQVEDCYAALLWTVQNAGEPVLGFNLDNLILCGGSAGGNLTAGVSLLARDRGGPSLRAQMLFYPWLDDSGASTSLTQYGDVQPWTTEDNKTALDWVLGANRENKTIYTVPESAGVEELKGLPTTYVDVGEADVFRVEDVDFVTRLWAAGVTTEFHVWPGAWHAFDTFAPSVEVSRRAARVRTEWVAGLIGQTGHWKRY
ncbi:Alpha/Beta hydrolase protein [Aspergillus pseudoustus]|uniref:Alpha/Beta hydrolase protein n=1 Tax=Aspergillus pseudoustus TaxID=1810923 RepID=A0ABR4J5R3_9EURO